VGDSLKPTPQQIEALARLRGTGDFKIFEEVVREYEHELVERLVSAREIPVIHQAQGGITACRELARVVNEAPDTLRKLAK
jgi:hypothetical protein